MRVVEIRTPDGQSDRLVELALKSGISRVSVSQGLQHRADGPTCREAVVSFQSSTPAAKKFMDALLAAPFFNFSSYSVTVKQAESLLSAEPVSQVTKPLAMPASDIRENLSQFSHVTISFLTRVFAAAALLSYGMIHNQIPILIAGLVFIPTHHQLLAIGMGLLGRDWRLAGQGIFAFSVIAVLVTTGAALVAGLHDPPLGFQQFSSVKTGLYLNLLIGLAAGFAASDDSGRMELIGLAASSQITIIPAWLGTALSFGLPEPQLIAERLLSFAVNAAAFTAASILAFAALGMKWNGRDQGAGYA